MLCSFRWLVVLSLNPLVAESYAVSVLGFEIFDFYEYFVEFCESLQISSDFVESFFEICL